jgi:hypothetical protein
MATDALNAYLADRAAGTDALLICDTWEIADALNRRLHDTFATAGPTLTVARDQLVASGDIIVSRRNDPTIDVRAGARSADRMDQVRNGNRWRVAAIDTKTNRLVAERLSDGARAVFGGDYLQHEVTLGYATTVHSAQGVTADSSYAVLGEGSSRAMLYVAVTRGRHTNEAFLYQKLTNEADHEHSRPTHGKCVHVGRRGNKYSAAQHFRTILANDERPRTVHAEAQRIDSRLLPDLVAQLVLRNRHRCRSRRHTWSAHTRATELRNTGYDRIRDDASAVRADIDAGGMSL